VTETSSTHAAARADRYTAAMALGAAQYADVLTALTEAGFPTVFTQTRGMCAALEITLDNGGHLLVTDAEDTLAWNRADHAGWGVGLYPRDDDQAYDSGSLAYGSTPDSDTAALLALVHDVLCSERWPA
jgi:hypothetical protein